MECEWPSLEPQYCSGHPHMLCWLAGGKGPHLNPLASEGADVRCPLRAEQDAGPVHAAAVPGVDARHARRPQPRQGVPAVLRGLRLAGARPCTSYNWRFTSDRPQLLLC